MSVLALRNGRWVAEIPVENRGLAYGDGLFETIKVSAGHAQFLAQHLMRLRRDCERIALALDIVALQSDIMALNLAQRSGILKIIVTRKSGGRGYAAVHQETERLLVFYPQQFITRDARATDGIAVRLCRQRLAEQPALAGMKHLNRLEQIMARSEWRDDGVAEGLMCDTAGRLIEGTMSNVFLVRAGRVSTPRLHRCGVAGVMREIILRQLASRCASVDEADLLLDDLYEADEVFVSNSVIGIWPVRKVECLHKAIGDVTIAFQCELQKLLTDENI